MKQVKSERLRKLETELNDLEEWLKLGLVPKKDIDKHKVEIRNVKEKLKEEKERLQFLKESGEAEEYVAPKRATGRTGYTDMPTIPDIDVGDTVAAMTEVTGYETETEVEEGSDNTVVEEEKEEAGEEAGGSAEAEEDEESYFSDKARWRRARDIIDPDAAEW